MPDGLLFQHSITSEDALQALVKRACALRDLYCGQMPDIQFCMENRPVNHAAGIMRKRQIRRLVVLDGSRRLTGIISLGDLAVDVEDEHVAGMALEGVSQPGPQR